MRNGAAPEDQTSTTSNQPTPNEDRAVRDHQPEEHEDRRPEPDPVAKADLAQQTRMANAAEAQVGVSRDQLHAMAWEGELSLASIIVAAAAAVFAGTAALVSWWGIRDASRHAEKELRAYVNFVPGPISRGTHLYASVFTRNSGQTAARKVRIKIRAALVSDQAMITNSFPIGAASDGECVLMPGASTRTYEQFSEIDVTSKEIDQLLRRYIGRSADHKLYVFAEATYLEVFGESRYTRNCWHYIFSTGNIEAFKFGGYLPGYQYTGQNNYMDDDDKEPEPPSCFKRLRMVIGGFIAGAPPRP